MPEFPEKIFNEFKKTFFFLEQMSPGPLKPVGTVKADFKKKHKFEKPAPEKPAPPKKNWKKNEKPAPLKRPGKPHIQKPPLTSSKKNKHSKKINFRPMPLRRQLQNPSPTEHNVKTLTSSKIWVSKRISEGVHCD